MLRRSLMEEDVAREREYAAAQEGLAQKSAEFRAAGGEIYIPIAPVQVA